MERRTLWSFCNPIKKKSCFKYIVNWPWKLNQVHYIMKSKQKGAYKSPTRLFTKLAMQTWSYHWWCSRMIKKHHKTSAKQITKIVMLTNTNHASLVLTK
jgi:hypothetical protein